MVDALQRLRFGQEENAAQKLKRLSQASVEAMTYGPDLFRILGQVPGGFLDDQMSLAHVAIVGQVRSVLEEHRSQLRISNLDRAARIIVSASYGVGIWMSDEVRKRDLANELNEVFALYLMGESQPAS